MALRPGRWITPDEKKFFMELKPTDITKSFLQKLFSDTYDIASNKIVKSTFNTYDQFVINPGEYYNKNKIITNCGLFIFNKRCLELTFIDRMGYYNNELTKKNVGKLNNEVAQYAAESEENLMKYIDYLNKLRWLADCIHTDICSTANIASFKPNPKVQAKKQKLINQYEKELKAGDIEVADKITKELLSDAKEILKDDPSYELFASGARGAFDNAYRTMNIMAGAVLDPITGKYNIITNSLYDGYDKKDIATIANNVIYNFFLKAIGPGEAGYLKKQIDAAFQTVILDKPGSDCGVKDTREIVMTDYLFDLYLYSYIVEGGKYVELTPENKSKYVGKTVKMRTSDKCINPNTCNICAGNRFYREGIEKVGLTITSISGVFLNGNMKGSHDTTVRLTHVSIDDMTV